MTTTETVGIVLVSHSRRLAEGAAELAALVAGPDVQIVGVGGTDDGRLGTSFDALVHAVETVSRGGGVVVIPDLGSSVLTTRTYLEGDDEDRPDDVVLVDAPFVEGAVAAAVAASAGLELTAVVSAAEEARDVRKL